MKKILLLLALTSLLCFSECTNAQSAPSVTFNGKTFVIKYSKKIPQEDTYMNEYYLPKQKYNNWTELIGIYNYPSFPSPIIFASKLQAQLKAKDKPVEMFINKEENIAIVSFMVGGGTLPTKMELNTFIFKPSDNGTIAFQYTKRYLLKSPEDMKTMNKDVDDIRMGIIQLITKVTIPELIKKDIDLGK